MNREEVKVRVETSKNRVLASVLFEVRSSGRKKVGTTGRVNLHLLDVFIVELTHNGLHPRTLREKDRSLERPPQQHLKH